MITTLGTGEDEQIIDALHNNSRSNFLLHYNRPPYSVGEVGRFALRAAAWATARGMARAGAVLPAATDFPYTIRVVSEITGSNDSSSMAPWRRLPVDDGCRFAESGRCRCCHGPRAGR